MQADHPVPTRTPNEDPRLSGVGARSRGPGGLSPDPQGSRGSDGTAFQVRPLEHLVPTRRDRNILPAGEVEVMKNTGYQSWRRKDPGQSEVPGSGESIDEVDVEIPQI